MHITRRLGVITNVAGLDRSRDWGFTRPGAGRFTAVPVPRRNAAGGLGNMN